MVQAQQVVGVIIIVLQILLVVTIAPQFYANRKVQPIRVRGPRMVLAFNFIATTVLFFSWLKWILILECRFNLFIDLQFPVAQGCWYCGRAFVVWIKFEKSKEQMNMKKLDTGKIGWFSRHRWLTTAKGRWIVIGCPYILLTSLGLCVIWFSPETAFDDLDNPNCDLIRMKIMMGILIFLIIVTVIFFSSKLNASLDFFWIREEFKFMLIGASGASILYLLWEFIPALRRFNADVFPISTLIAGSFTTYTVIVGTVIPYLISQGKYQYFKVLDTQLQAVTLDGVSLGTLEDVLQIEMGYQKFRQFLQAEWSLENLLFWDEINAFKREFEGILENAEAALQISAIQERVMMIYESFLNEDADLQVNIPSKIYNQIRKTVERIDECSPEELLTIYDKAQTNVWTLMKNDSFDRFKQTPLYADLVEVIESHKDLISALRDSGIGVEKSSKFLLSATIKEKRKASDHNKSESKEE